MSLCSCGGEELPIVGHAVCRLSSHKCDITALLQMQKVAPVDLLVGTDILHQLGFDLIQQDKTNSLGGEANNSATSDHKNSRLVSGHASPQTNKQKRQKKQHDKSAKNADFRVGDHVFVSMPALTTGAAWKLAWP